MSDRDHKRVAEPSESRGLAVVRGSGVRRRWPPAAKARIVSESYGRGRTVSDVARRHGLAAQQLFAWRRQLREAAAASEGAVDFAPVAVDRAVLCGGDGASVVVEMAGAVVRVPAGASPAMVATVLQALRCLP